MSPFQRKLNEALYDILPEALEINVEAELINKMAYHEYSRIFKECIFKFFPTGIRPMYFPYIKFNYAEKLTASLNKHIESNKRFLEEKAKK